MTSQVVSWWDKVCWYFIEWSDFLFLPFRQQNRWFWRGSRRPGWKEHLSNRL